MKSFTESYKTLTTMTNEQIFKRILGGNNFMTPYVVDYFSNRTYVCELSYGSGMGMCMYGCTFVNKVTEERAMDLDTSFCDTNEERAHKQAMDYIKEILN